MPEDKPVVLYRPLGDDPSTATLYYGQDCRISLEKLDTQSIHCIVTGPPYWTLRTYGGGPYEIGQETDLRDYVASIVDVFRSAHRVLRNDGTLWINLGDSYKNKQLLGIPWRVAFALQDDGWVLRRDIIWHKKVIKPESCHDRPSGDHEYLFLFAKKGSNYYYDENAIREPTTNSRRPQLRRAQELMREKGLTDEHLRAVRSCGITDVGKSRATQTGTGRNTQQIQQLADEAKTKLGGYLRELLSDGEFRNKRSVWGVPQEPYTGSHKAVYPPKLIEPCVLAGCPPGGIVLDPFSGSGTTGYVALYHHRNYIGLDLNAEFLAEAKARILSEPPPHKPGPDGGVLQLFGKST